MNYFTMGLVMYNSFLAYKLFREFEVVCSTSNEVIPFLKVGVE